MKLHYTLILAALATSISASAQTDKTTILRTPKFAIGVEAGFFKECLNRDSASNRLYMNYRQRASYPTVGVFARHYIGNRFAVQAGISTAFIKDNIYSGYLNGFDGIAALPFNGTVSTRAYDANLSLQYYLHPATAKMRAYFGAGINTRYNKYNIDGYYISNNAALNTSITDVQLGLLLSQGITWHVHKNWQVNESINLITNGNTTNGGIKIGLAYTIR